MRLSSNHSTMVNKGSREFRRDEAQVRHARGWLRDRLMKLDRPPDDELIERACLLLSETFTNAVVHGGRRVIRVAFEMDDGSITIETVGWAARDNLPRLRTLPSHDDPLWEGGRGLLLVDALSWRWGWDLAEAGRVRVWFRLPRDQARSASPISSRPSR